MTRPSRDGGPVREERLAISGTKGAVGFETRPYGDGGTGVAWDELLAISH